MNSTLGRRGEAPFDHKQKSVNTKIPVALEEVLRGGFLQG